LADFHSIRLHGPWQATVFEWSQSAPANSGLNSESTKGESIKRLKVPCDWADWPGFDFRGFIRLVRKFNLPTNLEPDQAVWLVAESVFPSGTFELNGQPIGNWQSGDPLFRKLIGGLLLPHNELSIVVDASQGPGDSPCRDNALSAHNQVPPIADLKLLDGVRLEIET
jgi:hypothetical protein